MRSFGRSRRARECRPEHRYRGSLTEEISYHVKLLAEAGLVEAGVADGQFRDKQPDGSLRTRGRKVYSPISLTWVGHEFLDAARDNTRWNSAKRKVMDTTGGLAFEFLRAVLMRKGKELLRGWSER